MRWLLREGSEMSSRALERDGLLREILREPQYASYSKTTPTSAQERVEEYSKRHSTYTPQSQD